LDQDNKRKDQDSERGSQSTSESKSTVGMQQILNAHKDENHLVVLQDFPDPDAIACAFAHQLISKAFNINVDIIYNGEISHQQNKALVKLVEVEMISFDKNPDLSNYDASIFIDNQGTTCIEIVDALEAAKIPTLIVVDHHELQDRLQAEFADIRSHVGATSTIYSEYLEKGDVVQLDKSKREHVLVATALYQGLYTDTGSLFRANEEDFHAAGFLSNYRDSDLFEQIMSQRRSKQTMDIIQKALGERIIGENYSIVGIGYLRGEDRDAIPQAADFLLSEENVHTAIVYGIVIEDDEETLIGSLRTSKLTLDPDDFIKDVFGKNASGYYFGGGKMSAGGFTIPVGFLSGDGGHEYRQLKWKVYDQQIKEKLFAKIGFQPSTSNET
jgi:nanoRNase/pAp phosphatase (c-di-AMP/oligoRNAs hydrolase)